MKKKRILKITKGNDQAVRKKSDLEYNIKTINIKMVRAWKLVDGLKDEGIRWKEKIVELSKESKYLLANIITYFSNSYIFLWPYLYGI